MAKPKMAPRRRAVFKDAPLPENTELRAVFKDAPLPENTELRAGDELWMCDNSRWIAMNDGKCGPGFIRNGDRSRSGTVDFRMAHQSATDTIPSVQSVDMGEFAGRPVAQFERCGILGRQWVALTGGRPHTFGERIFSPREFERIEAGPVIFVPV